MICRLFYLVLMIVVSCSTAWAEHEHGGDKNKHREVIQLVGPAGPQGPIGLTGPKGATGPAGPQGSIGLTGPKGATGPAGPQGPIGLTGPKGATGPAGPQGPIGLTGPKGATGPAGPQGPIGLTGAPGIDGAPAKPKTVVSATGNPIGQFVMFESPYTEENPTFKTSAGYYMVPPTYYSVTFYDGYHCTGNALTSRTSERGLITRLSDGTWLQLAPTTGAPSIGIFYKNSSWIYDYTLHMFTCRSPGPAHYWPSIVITPANQNSYSVDAWQPNDPSVTGFDPAAAPLPWSVM